MVMVGPARKAGRGSCLIPDHLDLAAIDRLANFVPAEPDGAITRPEIPKTPHRGASGSLTSPPPCPHPPATYPPNRPMPLSAPPSPAVDPVLISFGPVAIRWYALAYIVGILLGWLYARAIIRRERFWASPVPMTVTD